MKQKISLWWFPVLILIMGIAIGQVEYFILFACIPLAFHFSRKAGLPAWPLTIFLAIVAVSVAAANFPDIAKSTAERFAVTRLKVNQWIRPLNAGIDSVNAQATTFFSGQATRNAKSIESIIEDSVKSGKWSAAHGKREWDAALDTLRLKKTSRQPRIEPVSYQPSLPFPSPSSPAIPGPVTISRGETKVITVGKGWQEVDVNRCPVGWLSSDTILVAHVDGLPVVSAPNDSTRLPYAPQLFMRSKTGNPVSVTLTGE